MAALLDPVNMTLPLIPWRQEPWAPINHHRIPPGNRHFPDPVYLYGHRSLQDNPWSIRLQDRIPDARSQGHIPWSAMAVAHS
ncbi:uncharacterized protein B0I36DRAFT_311610 [Microdochium trichocladiopsis]|uniref:Uncharacterized protein n=1 Tax=Microdochium trichocladiopsis TaxID=1682393 RepID=A0A9P9BUC2_9PEZI|nr:uncharacterized protein B0I36DRAFT_311610 [Microdochium trichocladiopsis]KAH7040841.1 hypothetical protein B0I36DRAFT_311610 [Microdochium trichocladiopsis]